mgnify:CR=1 FL=1
MNFEPFRRKRIADARAIAADMTGHALDLGSRPSRGADERRLGAGGVPALCPVRRDQVGLPERQAAGCQVHRVLRLEGEFFLCLPVSLVSLGTATDRSLKRLDDDADRRALKLMTP